MPVVKGFNEKFGNELKEKHFFDTVLSNIAYKYCYDQIQIPLVEYSTSFDENVVGKSPWPEWNSSGIFNFKIKNYNNSYKEEPFEENVLLIPEGTTSVTRWLGDKINNSDYEFPIKIFYNLSCYRNELLSSLTKTKRREFNQFGFEILGTKCIQSDCEILNIIFDSLINLGIKKESITIRVNEISIYKLLCKESNLENDEEIRLKEYLDYLAECKAGKHPEKYDETYQLIKKILSKHNLKSSIKKKWETLLSNNSGSISSELYSIFGNKYHKFFDELLELQKCFKSNNQNIFIDLCVIRSHEYYTGISFEVDVNYKNKRFIEIAGGGRFDRLVSNFVNNCTDIIVPSTGFAFGTERVLEMLKELHLINNSKVEIKFNYDKSNYIVPKSDSITSYFECINSLKKDESINVFIDYNRNNTTEMKSE